MLLLVTLALVAAISCAPEKKIKAVTITYCSAEDKFGEIVADSSESFEVRRYEYNDKGQMVRELGAGKSYGDFYKDTTLYIYNERNLLTEIISGNMRQDMQYDESGNIVRNCAGERIFTFAYDDSKKLAEIKSFVCDTLQEVNKFKHRGDTVICYTYTPDGASLLHKKVSVKYGDEERLLSGEYSSRYDMKIKYSAKWEDGVPIETENAYTRASAEGFFIFESGYKSGKEYSKYIFNNFGDWIQKIDYMEHFDGERSPTNITFREIEYFQ